MGYCLLLAALATTPLTAPLSAQAPPRFEAAQFACVSFRVHAHTTVTTELQGRTRQEELDRDGRLTIRGTPADGGIAIEAWWDSLALSRAADGDTLTPDPSGILGGRYRGLLHPDGKFERTAAPWVPDEVAEVSDLGVALDDLFPRFSDGTLRQIGDAGGMRRWRLTEARELDSPADSTRPFAVHESESSEGIIGWDREGLRSWVRTIRSETRVKETPRRTFRSEAVQRVEFQRVSWCGSGAAGGIAQ